MDNYHNYLILRKVLVKVVFSSILFNLFINDIFNEYDIYGISIGDKRCCGGLFADDIIIYAPIRSQFMKLLKFTSRWARNNDT